MTALFISLSHGKFVLFLGTLLWGNCQPTSTFTASGCYDTACTSPMEWTAVVGPSLKVSKRIQNYLVSSNFIFVADNVEGRERR